MSARSLPSQDLIRQCFTYNRHTGELHWKVRPREHFQTDNGWKNTNSRLAKKIAGYKNNCGYIVVLIDYKLFLAHRIIWKGMTGNDPPAEIDHINRNKADNRWVNLRLATRYQSTTNIGVHANNITGLKGIFPHRQKFSAQITHNKKRYHLGTFPTAKEAHAAYCEAAQKLHGEFWSDGERT